MHKPNQTCLRKYFTLLRSQGLIWGFGRSWIQGSNEVVCALFCLCVNLILSYSRGIFLQSERQWLPIIPGLYYTTLAMPQERRASYFWGLYNHREGLKCPAHFIWPRLGPPPRTVTYSKTLACIKILWRICPETLTVPYVQSFYFSRSRIDSKTGIFNKFQVRLSLLVQGSYFVYHWPQRWGGHSEIKS